MQETGCQSVGEYIEAVERDPEVRRRFECSMAVSISRFFRDRELWAGLLKGRILPELAGRANRTVKAWSAGCASGEEPYSLKMLWGEIGRSAAPLADLALLATDLCPESLERAKEAVYPQSSLREVPEPFRSVCFERMERGKVAVSPWVREGISWQVQDLLSDPPGTAFDLVFLRNNLLTYYRDEIKIPALRKVVDSLAPGGFLIVGRRERLPVERADLRVWGESGYVFQKRPHGA